MAFYWQVEMSANSNVGDMNNGICGFDRTKVIVAVVVAVVVVDGVVEKKRSDTIRHDRS